MSKKQVSHRMYYIGSNYKLYTIYLPNVPQLPNIQNSGESSTDPSSSEHSQFNNSNNTLPKTRGLVNDSSILLRPQTLPQGSRTPDAEFTPSPMLLAHEYALVGKALRKDARSDSDRRRGPPLSSGGYGPWGWGGYMHNNWRERGYMSSSTAPVNSSSTDDTGTCTRYLLICMAAVVLCLICVIPVMVLIDKYGSETVSNINNSTHSTLDDNG